MKRKPTIVLLSASTGYGHTKAALSLKQAFEDKLPNWNIVHQDTSADSSLPRQISVEQLWAFF